MQSSDNDYSLAGLIIFVNELSGNMFVSNQAFLTKTCASLVFLSIMYFETDSSNALFLFIISFLYHDEDCQNV